MTAVSSNLNAMEDNFFAQLESRITALQHTSGNIIRLDIGSPDLPPAAHILDALVQAAHQPDSHGYQAHAGTRELRQAWTEMYARQHGVRLDPERQIVPLLGSKEGIFHFTQAMVEPGDVVILPDPGYMTYARAAAFAGGEPYLLPLRPENGFLPDLTSIPKRVLQRAKLLWLNYPNNPTGASAPLHFFGEAVDFARTHSLLLCHDAAYTQVTFDGYRAPSLLEIPGALEVAVEFNSLSKAYNMAGWRVGVMVGQPEAVKGLFRLKSNIDSGHFLPVLRAASLALSGDQEWIKARNQVYCQRRDTALQALAGVGINVPAPQAAIYLWCPVPQGWTSMDFVTAVLERAHVSLAPGTVFGPGGEGYFRVSLTASQEQIETAFQRIGQVLENLKRYPG